MTFARAGGDCATDLCHACTRNRLVVARHVRSLYAISGLPMELAVMSLIVSDHSFRHASCWSTVRSLFAEWQQRVQSRFELERLSERDLLDMKLTRLEIFDETQKPFWQK
jgi:uncharacterized protein YjiS (DUF1127 family)